VVGRYLRFGDIVGGHYGEGNSRSNRYGPED
jgi:hypothetical protein